MLDSMETHSDCSILPSVDQISSDIFFLSIEIAFLRDVDT